MIALENTLIIRARIAYYIDSEDTLIGKISWNSLTKKIGLLQVSEKQHNEKTYIALKIWIKPLPIMNQNINYMLYNILYASVMVTYGPGAMTIHLTNNFITD